MPVKIFLASKFSRQSIIRGIRDDLTQFYNADTGIGHYEVVSSWLDIPTTSVPPRQHGTEAYDNYCYFTAASDFADVCLADLLICDLSEDESQSRPCGALIEIGIALGRSIPVWLIGELPTVYRQGPHVYEFESWQAVFEVLGQPQQLPTYDVADPDVADYVPTRYERCIEDYGDVEGLF